MIQELVNTLTRASQSVPEFSATAGELEPGWFPTDDLTDLKSGRLADALARLAADYPGADTRTQAALFINQYACISLALRPSPFCWRSACRTSH